MRLAVLPVVAVLSLSSALAATAYADAPDPGRDGSPGWVHDPGRPVPTPLPEPTATIPPQNGNGGDAMGDVTWHIVRVPDTYGGALLCITGQWPDGTTDAYGCLRPVNMRT